MKATLKAPRPIPLLEIPEVTASSHRASKYDPFLEAAVAMEDKECIEINATAAMRPSACPWKLKSDRMRALVGRVH